MSGEVSETKNTDRTKQLLQLAAAAAGVMLLEFLTVTIMRAANGLPVPVKAPLFIFLQWLPLAAPAAVMKLRGESIREALRIKEKPIRQIALGAAGGFVMSVVLMLIPFALGFKEYIYTNGGYTKLWQAFYYLASYIIGTGVAEELIFRGFFLTGLERAAGTPAAVIGSSLLFGLMHIFNGDLAQVIFTAVIGLILCFAGKKLPGFTLLSLIFMHGIYDFMIPVWAGLF